MWRVSKILVPSNACLRFLRCHRIFTTYQDPVEYFCVVVKCHYTQKFSHNFLSNFRAPFFRKFLFFFAVWQPLETPRHTPAPLKDAFPLGNRVLRHQQGEAFRKEGDGGEGGNKRTEGRARSGQHLLRINWGFRISEICS